MLLSACMMNIKLIYNSIIMLSHDSWTLALILHRVAAVGLLHWWILLDLDFREGSCI